MGYAASFQGSPSGSGPRQLGFGITHVVSKTLSTFFLHEHYQPLLMLEEKRTNMATV
jgi:hypothetical protein